MMLETQLIICVVHYFSLTDSDRPFVQLEQNSFMFPIATKREQNSFTFPIATKKVTEENLCVCVCVCF